MRVLVRAAAIVPFAAVVAVLLILKRQRKGKMNVTTEKANLGNIQTACAQLIRLGEEIVHSLNQANPKTDRVMLFQLSALRAIRLASACLLLDENGYVEEVLALTRTLSEVAINACYLQMAADQEVASFRVFDIQKSFRMSENLAKKMDATDTISVQERVKLQGIAAAARTKSQRKDNDMSWSTDHVAIRAEKLDKTMASGTEMFSLLKGSTYEFAHPFVHGTYQSFRAVSRLMSEGTFPADGDRETERIQALGGVNQCLLALCVYAHVKLGLPIEAEIHEASRINLAP